MKREREREVSLVPLFSLFLFLESLLFHPLSLSPALAAHRISRATLAATAFLLSQVESLSSSQGEEGDGDGRLCWRSRRREGLGDSGNLEGDIEFRCPSTQSRAFLWRQHPLPFDAFPSFLPVFCFPTRSCPLFDYALSRVGDRCFRVSLSPATAATATLLPPLSLCMSCTF